MKATSFLTILDAGEGIYKEKGSKFMAFAYRVKNETEIDEKIKALQKKYFDARHHCYAWILGVDQERFRVFDDGEPHHSAGDPILGQIKSRNLSHVLVVVVRYFGGVKLGVGGLMVAYREAASEALKAAQIVTERVRVAFTWRLPFLSLSEGMGILKEVGANIGIQKYGEDCELNFLVEAAKVEAFLNRVERLNLNNPIDMGTEIF